MEDLREKLIVKERYRLSKKLGEGSFGEVWLAEDMLLDNMQVALKFYQRTDSEGQTAFTREYTRVLHLKHDNLLTASYFDFYQRRPFLVMDYCSRGAASQYKGHMEEKKVWQFVHDVAAGLAYMHRQQPPIIHQDIKPGNVLVHSTGRFVVTDFGISRSTLSGSGSGEALKSAGTIAYMGPERFKANAETIKASDIWSLGSSVYELVTGNVPFQGGGGVMLTAGAEMPALPSNYSKELNCVMQACMAKDTWDRPRADQLATYTEAIIRGEHPTPPWKSKSDGVEQPTAKSSALEKVVKIVSRRGVLIVLAVVAVVVLLGLLVLRCSSGTVEPSSSTGALSDGGKEYVEIVSLPEGKWKGGINNEGKPDGDGELSYKFDDPDGRQSYIGSMKNGKRHGKGVLLYKNGNSFDGEFRDDDLWNGTFRNVEDGLYFSGTFLRNAPQHGEWRYIDDNTLYEKI